MTEEKKRYSQNEHGLVFDALIWDSMDDVEMFQTDIVERLNTYETDITRILSDHDRLNVKCHKLESRVKELEERLKRYEQDDTVLMPSELTAENGAKDLLMGEFFEESKQDCPECYGDGCDDCGGVGSQTIRIPVSWSTIKQIYNVCVSNLSVGVSK